MPEDKFADDLSNILRHAANSFDIDEKRVISNAIRQARRQKVALFCTMIIIFVSIALFFV